jgi:hypothetical protein
MVRSRVLDGSILAYDIADYSLRTIDRQKKAQTLCNRVRLNSLAAVGPSVSSVEWLDAGDGGYLLLQGDVRSALHVVKAFVVELAEENSQLSADYQVHVRYAMHCGLVRVEDSDSGIRCAGDAINETARLLSSMSRAYRGQVVCSGKYRSRLVDQAGEPEALFVRLEDTIDKHGLSHEVWNVRQEPGFGVQPSGAELFDGSDRATAAIDPVAALPQVDQSGPVPAAAIEAFAHPAPDNRLESPADQVRLPPTSHALPRKLGVAAVIVVLVAAVLALLALQARRAHRLEVRANNRRAQTMFQPVLPVPIQGIRRHVQI